MTTRTKRVTVAAGGLLAAAAVLAPAANAETYEVNSLADPGDGTCDLAGTGDGCTLREAIVAANGHLNNPTGTPDEIDFAANVRGEIQLANSNPSSLQIVNDGVHINGPGADVLSVVGSGSDRVFKLFGFGTTPLDDYDVTISGLTVEGGSPGGPFPETGAGGGILSTDNGFYWQNSTFRCGSYAALTLNRVHVTDNDADAPGGGVAVDHTQCFDKAAPSTEEGALNVIDSTVSDNVTSAEGGGIAMGPGSGSLFVSNSTIAGNLAGGPGGGISVFRSTPTKVEEDVADTFDVYNSTVTENDTGSVGGGIYVAGEQVGLRSTIVSNNTSTPPEEQKVTSESDLATEDGSAFNAGYSLIGTRDGATVNDVPGEPNRSGDPVLGALQNNGGTTPTVLPETTSPAIDAGIANGLTTDQRGTSFARTVERSPANAVDGTDIGAVELPADPPQEVPEPDNPLPGPTTQLCLGKQVVLTKGGDADEKLPGTGTDDGILGGGGVDEILGFSGDDCLFGQVGNDKVEGGPGNDNANGDRDNDTVKGDGGEDSVRGQNGDDRVFGGPGDDTKVTGGAGDDTVKGGSGDDFLKGDGGNDVVLPGGGKDFVHSGGGADTVNAHDGEADEVVCGTGKDVANVDAIDKVDKDCNTVNVIAGPHVRL